MCPAFRNIHIHINLTTSQKLSTSDIMVTATTQPVAGPNFDNVRALGIQALNDNYASKQQTPREAAKEAYRKQIEDAQRTHLTNEMLKAAIEVYKFDQKDAVIKELREELQPAVIANLHQELRAEALQQLKEENLERVVRELKTDYKDAVIGMLKEDLRETVKRSLEQAVLIELRAELTPIVKQDLRQEFAFMIAKDLRQEMTRLPSPFERTPSPLLHDPLSPAIASDSSRGRRRHRSNSFDPSGWANENPKLLPDDNIKDEEVSTHSPQGTKRSRSSSVAVGDQLEDRGDGKRRRFAGFLEGGDRPARWDDTALEEWSEDEQENVGGSSGDEGEDDDGGDEGAEEDVYEYGSEDNDEDDEEDDDEFDPHFYVRGMVKVEIERGERMTSTGGASSNEVIDLISSDEEE